MDQDKKNKRNQVRLGIGFKLFFYNFVLPITLFVGLIFIVYREWRSYALKEYIEAVDFIATQLEGAINDDFNRVRQTLKDVAHVPAVRRFLEKDMPETLILDGNLNFIPEVPFIRQEILIPLNQTAEVDGIMLGSTRGPNLLGQASSAQLPPGYDARLRVWFLTAFEAGQDKTGISAPFKRVIDTDEDPFLITLSRLINAIPQVDDEGNNIPGDPEPVGVVSATYTLDWPFAMLEKYRREHEIFITLLQRVDDEMIVLNSEFYNIADQKKFSDLLGVQNVPETATNEIFNALTSQEVFIKNIRYAPDPENPGLMRDYILNVHQIKETPWTLVLSAPFRPIESEVSARLLPIFIISLSIFAIALGLVFLIAQWFIVKPIRNVAMILRDLSEGEGNLNKKIDVMSNDEISDLADSFNVFVEKLRSIIIHIKNTTSTVAGDKDELVVNMNQNASASNEISGNIESINTQIGMLNGEIQSISQAMVSVGESVSNLNLNSMNQSAAVEEATAAVEQVITALKNVAETITIKKEASQHLTGLIKKTGDTISGVAEANIAVVSQVERISNMSEVITSIAAQTNLLAMNAAIEAAHAGNSGRGFAVVAGEIRKLAETSSGSSQEISNAVKEILYLVNQASDAAHSSKNAFVTLGSETRSTIQALDEINQATQDLTRNGEQIIQSNGELNKSTIVVRENVKQIENAIDEVLIATKQAADVSASVNSGMMEIESGINEIARSVNHVQAISNQLSASTEELKRESSKFKTS